MLVLQHLRRRGVGHGAVGGFVLDKVPEVAVLALADGAVQGDRVPGDLHHPLRLLHRDAGGLGGLLHRRLAAELLQQFRLRHFPELRHRLDHVHRDADRAGLVRDRPGDRLADPPRGVGAELVAAAVLVFVDGPHQAGVALLDQVQERQPAVAVLLGDRDDQPQVAAGQVPHRLLVGAEAVLRISRTSSWAASSGVSSVMFCDHVQLALQVRPLLGGGLQVLHLARVARTIACIRWSICSSRFMDRDDLLRPQAQLLDQDRDLAACAVPDVLRLAPLLVDALGVHRIIGRSRPGSCLAEVPASAGCAASAPGSASFRAPRSC